MMSTAMAMLIEYRTSPVARNQPLKLRKARTWTAGE
jgi:hypothetical protein